jgi:hypothetical protein
VSQPQAKDIPDEAALSFVEKTSHTPHQGTGNAPPEGGRWVFWWDFESAGWLKHWPSKVLRAKLRALYRRGLLDGCPCGCRGDWVLTDAGRALLASVNDEAADADGRRNAGMCR